MALREDLNVSLLRVIDRLCRDLKENGYHTRFPEFIRRLEGLGHTVAKELEGISLWYRVQKESVLVTLEAAAEYALNLLGEKLFGFIPEEIDPFHQLLRLIEPARRFIKAAHYEMITVHLDVCHHLNRPFKLAHAT
jgi:hypothetical protein